MKKLLLVMGVVLALSGQAEASRFGDGLRKTWGYATGPVNCVALLGKDLMDASIKFVICTLGNINPGNLIP